MFNVSLAASILIVTVVPPISRILLRLADHFTPVVLGQLGIAIIGLFFKYFVLALVLLVAVRFTRLWPAIESRSRGKRTLFVANVIVVLFWVLKVVASLIAGWAGSFMVGYFAPLVLWPSCILIVVGFVMLSRSPPSKAVANASIS